MYFVYLLANRKYGTLYIGVTSDLHRRLGEHAEGISTAFTAKYGVHRLVYAEEFLDVNEAIVREKQLKGWNRAWRIKLIERTNPDWEDISNSLPYA